MIVRASERQSSRETKLAEGDVVIFFYYYFRYRKQMEEMQKAFNKTIIKLQNTSRIAEEQVSNEDISTITLVFKASFAAPKWQKIETTRCPRNNTFTYRFYDVCGCLICCGFGHTGPAADRIHSVAAGPAGECDSAGPKPVC